MALPDASISCIWPDSSLDSTQLHCTQLKSVKAANVCCPACFWPSLLPFLRNGLYSILCCIFGRVFAMVYYWLGAPNDKRFITSDRIRSPSISQRIDVETHRKVSESGRIDLIALTEYWSFDFYWFWPSLSTHSLINRAFSRLFSYLCLVIYDSSWFIK